MLFKSTFALAVATFTAFGPAKAQDASGGGGGNLLQVIQANAPMFYGLFNTSYPDIISTLNNTNASYTVFAPNDAAITQAVALLPTISDVKDLILYHIVNGTFNSTSLQSGSTIVDSLANNSTLLKWSNATGLPLEIIKNSTSSSQKRATSADPTTTGSSTTSSSGIYVVAYNQAAVTQADIAASNGVVHLVSSLLTWPLAPSYTLQNSPNLGGQLSSFLKALTLAGLNGTIDGQNGITIFAPSNDAIGNKLTGLDNNTLSKILKYHIVNAVYYASNLSSFTNPTNITASENDNLTITATGKNAFTVGNTNTTGHLVPVNTITTTNILTDNGVIHIIDQVLWPPNATSNNSNNGSNGGGNGGGSSAASTSQVSMGLLLSVIAVACTLFL